MKPLSPTQADLLDRMFAPLVRCPGGYWTPEPLRPDVGAPAWWVGTRTVVALIERGLLRQETPGPLHRSRVIKV